VVVVSRVSKIFMNQQRTLSTRLAIAIVVFVVVAALTATTTVAVIDVSQIAMWVPIIALGLAD
jgi:hypothetical protein